MGTPLIKSGKFSAGRGFICGENVVIDVAEEVVLGNHCVLGDNTYISGRLVTIGNHFYGYSWEWRRLDIGRSRRDSEHAILTVGDRCTFHDNTIDLSSVVTIGNDVGLSPQVAIYTHYYWKSILDGFPCKWGGVTIEDGVIVGFRSVILPESMICRNAVIGAQSVVSRFVSPSCIYAGNPARRVRAIRPLESDQRDEAISSLFLMYKETLEYRGITGEIYHRGSLVWSPYWQIDLITPTIQGTEDELSDDLRDFLFRRGIRIYTERPFRRIPRQY